jgi:hypothetical protein
LIVWAYIIENLSTCFCGESKPFTSNYLHHLGILGTVVSFVSSILLLVGGIIYSPLIGHQEDREAVFIVGEIGFIAF